MSLWSTHRIANSLLKVMAFVACLEVASANGANDLIYFLVGAFPATQPRDSAVIPLSRPEDIQHARDLIVKGLDAGLAMAAVSLGCGQDGINRNYFDPTFPATPNSE